MRREPNAPMQHACVLSQRSPACRKDGGASRRLTWTMESLESLRRRAAIAHALRSREGVTRIQPTPVQLRVITGHAVAYTATQVLVEWEAYGEYHVRWEDNWQVKRI